LLKNGFEPIPLNGKIPIISEWQNLRPTLEDIVSWERVHTGSVNTGILTRLTPAADIDVLDQEVADIIHGWVRAFIPHDCPELVRIGKAPKRAIIFRCDVPFSKVSTGKWVDDAGIEHQLEILCDGQQVAVYGEHPDTHQAYAWPGVSPGRIQHSALPILTLEAAQSLVDRAIVLFRERGWRPKRTEHPKDPPRASGFERSDSLAHKIATGLADRIESLCRELLPNGRIEGKNWAVGSINGEPGKSMRVCLIGENRGLWLDFADEGYRGDALDLVEAVKNLKPVEAMEWGCHWLGWEWPSRARTSSEWRDDTKSETGKQQSTNASALQNFIFVSDDVPSPQRMLIESVMPAEGLPFIGGQSSAGKTFIAILIAVCAAGGRPLFGHEVKERVGAVIVAAEGKSMLRARIAAAMKELEVEGDVPVAWVKQVPDFNRADGLQAFVRDLRALSEHFQQKFGVRLGLVFVDTVSASFDIKEEADNAEAARVCKVNRDSPRCCR
jgi:hypothetical protein